MKNANLSGAILTRLIKPAMFVLLYLGLQSAVAAQTADSKTKEVPAEVKYIGSESGKPLFQISYSNPQGAEVLLTLRDENGFTIYSDVSKEKAYLRKLQFNDLDTEKIKMTLTLRTRKETQTQNFEITKSTRTIEDVAVVSL